MSRKHSLVCTSTSHVLPETCVLDTDIPDSSRPCGQFCGCHPLTFEGLVIFTKVLKFFARERSQFRDDRDTELLRAELLSVKQLTRHAVFLAEQHQVDPRPGPDRLLPRLSDNARVLRQAYNVVTAADAPGQAMGPTEAWLLDNFYLIEQQVSLARRHLPSGYSRQLPRLADGKSAGFPRIYNLALELISHMDGRVDNENVTCFIRAYQTVEPLRLGELWAFPIMLRLALLENLRRVGVRIAQRREAHDAAARWADRMLAAAESDPKQLIQLLAEFAHADVPLTAPFVEEFYSRLQAQGPAMAFVQTWVEQKLMEQGITATKLSEVAGRTTAANQISIANSIGSLRFISAMDWKHHVESLSVVEKALCEDPAGVYAQQDFATRDRYRNAIERMARGSACSEMDVAREALVLARAAALGKGRHDRSAHVGFYLIDQGITSLEHTVGCRLALLNRVKRACRRVRLPLYIGPILILTVLITVCMLIAIGGFAAIGWYDAFLMTFGVVAASALAVTLVNQVAMLFIPPHSLPRMDFSQGIPLAHRTMVIVPTLLGSRQEIDNLLEAYMDAPVLPSPQSLMVRRKRLQPYIRTLLCG